MSPKVTGYVKHVQLLQVYRSIEGMVAKHSCSYVTLSDLYWPCHMACREKLASLCAWMSNRFCKTYRHLD